MFADHDVKPGPIACRPGTWPLRKHRARACSVNVPLGPNRGREGGGLQPGWHGRGGLRGCCGCRMPPYGQVIGVRPACSKASRSSMIASRVPAFRVPSRRPDTCVAEAVQASADVERRRDPSAAPPAGDPAAADGGAAEAEVDRPGAVRRAADAHIALMPRRAALVLSPLARSCAGTAISSAAAGPPSQNRRGQGGHRPIAPSSAWCCAWRPTMSIGGAGGSLASWPGSVSPSRPRRSGRS
jgi:hypothetical protein